MCNLLSKVITVSIRQDLDRITTPDQIGLRELYNIFYSVPDFEIPIVRYSIYPGSSLIRQRVNKKRESFKNIAEIYYPPASVTPMERANLPGNPMFYACSFPSEITDQSPIPRVIALEETSSFMRDTSQSGIERATVSRWNIIARIDLIALPYIGTYNRACPDLLRVKEKWEKTISQGVIPQDALELVNYMAEEISKDFSDRNQYFKIANFVHYLLKINQKTRDADGIIYPSVPARGVGFNVAIKPESADAKIRFSNASECHLLKKGMKMAVIPVSDAIVDEYGGMTFKDRNFTPEDMVFYFDNSIGLSFVN